MAGPPCLTCSACFVVVRDLPVHRLPIQFCGDRAACRNHPLGHAIDAGSMEAYTRSRTAVAARSSAVAAGSCGEEAAGRISGLAPWAGIAPIRLSSSSVAGIGTSAAATRADVDVLSVLELLDSRSLSFVLSVAHSRRSERLSTLTPVAGQGSGGSDPGVHELVRTRILVRAHGGGGGDGEAC